MQSTLITILGFVSYLVLSSSQLRSAEIRVPEDFKTIQAAIDKASPKHVILVSPGTYRERLQLKPQIELRSVGKDDRGKLGLRRAETTIIDGGNNRTNAKAAESNETKDKSSR